MKLSNLANNKINNYDFNNKDFDLCNEILYKMTNANFSNKDADMISAKLMIIGRTYAAALERVHTKNIKVDYYDVAQKIITENVENDIQNLKSYTTIDENTILEVAKLHFKLTKIFEEFTKDDKRSLASKYLHFHLPKIVFIYDSRVVGVIGKFIDGNCQLKKFSKINNAEKNKEIDKDYVVYCLKAFEIYNSISKNNKFVNGNSSLPRYVDKILLRYCDEIGK